MIIDRCRNIEEFKKLYDSRPMPSQYPLKWLLNNPLLFCFYDELTGNLRAYITLQNEEGEFTLSGASVSKNYQDNIDAVKTICNFFKNKDIYSYTELKHAALVLRKAGFKKCDNDKYIRSKQNGT